MVTSRAADTTVIQQMNPTSDIAAALTDAVGTCHTPTIRDARIVSLVPSLTELLFDMNLGAQLVGRTHYCVHPNQELENVPSVGGTKKINMTRLAALAPTHVIVNIDENTKEMVDEIRSKVPNVIVTHPIEPEDNLQLFRLLGGIFGRRTEADRLCAQFETAQREALPSTTGPRRVLYLIWKDPWMTVSADTYISRLLAAVGWQTVGHDPDTRYPEVELSDSFLAGLDLVLFSSEPFAFTQTDADKFNTSHPKGPHALFVDGEMISWYGSRAIQGLRYLRELAQKAPE